MHGSVAPLSSVGKPLDTGGFFDPEGIADHFGIGVGMNIADFGCGSGYFTIILAERTGSGGWITALDVREEALDAVRSKSRSKNIDNIETRRADLEVLGSSGLADDSQDIVLMANILFQSRKHDSILIEGYRVLKSGGSLIMIDWKKDIEKLGPPDEYKVDPERIKDLAEKIGYKFEKDINAGHFHFGMMFKKQ